MRRTDAVRALFLAAATGLSACAGGGAAPGPPGEPPAEITASGAAHSFQELLSRLDILIATSDESDSVSAALIAEARALRTEALTALATGDEVLALEFLTEAVALFGEAPR